jgi:hypothetical protein
MHAISATMLKPLPVADFSALLQIMEHPICEILRRLYNNITDSPNSIDLAL